MTSHYNQKSIFSFVDSSTHKKHRKRQQSLVTDFSIEKQERPKWGVGSSKKTLSPPRVNSVGAVVQIGQQRIAQRESNGFEVTRKTINERFNTVSSISPQSRVESQEQGIGTQDDISNYFNQSKGLAKAFNKSTGTKTFK